MTTEYCQWLQGGRDALAGQRRQALAVHLELLQVDGRVHGADGEHLRDIVFGTDGGEKRPRHIQSFFIAETAWLTRPTGANEGTSRKA